MSHCFPLSGSWQRPATGYQQRDQWGTSASFDPTSPQRSGEQTWVHPTLRTNVWRVDWQEAKAEAHEPSEPKPSPREAKASAKSTVRASSSGLVEARAEPKPAPALKQARKATAEGAVELAEAGYHGVSRSRGQGSAAPRSSAHIDYRNYNTGGTSEAQAKKIRDAFTTFTVEKGTTI